MLSDKTLAKLEEISQFEAGWHYGKGVPFRAEILFRTRKLHEVAYAVGLTSDVFPMLDGTLVFCVYHKKGCLEFVVELDCTFSLDRDIGIRVIGMRANLSFAQAAQIIQAKGKPSARPSYYPLEPPLSN